MRHLETAGASRNCAMPQQTRHATAFAFALVRWATQAHARGWHAVAPALHLPHGRSSSTHPLPPPLTPAHDALCSAQHGVRRRRCSPHGAATLSTKLRCCGVEAVSGSNSKNINISKFRVSANTHSPAQDPSQMDACNASALFEGNHLKCAVTRIDAIDAGCRGQRERRSGQGQEGRMRRGQAAPLRPAPGLRLEGQDRQNQRKS